MNIYKRTFGAIKPYWKQLLIASVSAALNAVFSGLLVWMVGPLMSTLFQVQDVTGMMGQRTEMVAPAVPGVRGEGLWAGISKKAAKVKESMKGWVDSLVAGQSRSQMLVKFCIVILIVVLAKNLFLYLQGFFMIYVQQSMMRTFRDRLFDKYQRLSLDYFHHRRTGQIMSRVTNDVIVLNESIDLGFNRLVTDSTFVLVLFIFLVILSWKLTLLAMIILPVVFAFIWYVGKKMRKYSGRSQERMADVNSVSRNRSTTCGLSRRFRWRSSSPKSSLPPRRRTFELSST